jgi:hypothetical protein
MVHHRQVDFSGPRVRTDQLFALKLLNLWNLRNLWIVFWSYAAHPHPNPLPMGEGTVETLACGHSYDEIDEGNRLSRIWLTRRAQV